MIIQCESCARKYIVKDDDIPSDGRAVKCGYCSVTWYQMPTSKKVREIQKQKTTPTPKKVMTNERKYESSTGGMEASDGKIYKYLGNQWAQLLPSGKTGLFARKKISQELNEIVRRKTNESRYKKISEVDPLLENIGSENNLPDIYKEKKSLGFFGYVFLIIIFSFSSIALLKFFEDDLITNFPQLQYIFEIINMQLMYINETIENIILIATDLLESY